MDTQREQRQDFAIVLSVAASIILFSGIGGTYYAMNKKITALEDKIKILEKKNAPDSDKSEELPAKITLDSLGSLAYTVDSETRQLISGKYLSQNPTDPNIRLDADKTAISPDGQKAVVILIVDFGGSGFFKYAALVVSNQDGIAQKDIKHVTNGTIYSVAFNGKDLSINTLSHGPNDSNCCPSQNVTKRYAVIDQNKLEEK